jgi:hypothetical protein
MQGAWLTVLDDVPPSGLQNRSLRLTCASNRRCALAFTSASNRSNAIFEHDRKRCRQHERSIAQTRSRGTLSELVNKRPVKAATKAMMSTSVAAATADSKRATTRIVR